MSLKAGWKMLEGMIYSLLDGGSSQLFQLPRLAAGSSGWKQPHLLTLRADGITWVSNSGKRPHCKEQCTHTRPGRKLLEVCQTKVGNSMANPHLPVKLAMYATRQRHWPGRQGRQQSRETPQGFPAPADSVGVFYSLHLKKMNARYFHLIKSPSQGVRHRENACHSNASQHALTAPRNGGQRDYRIKRYRYGSRRVAKIYLSLGRKLHFILWFTKSES